MSTATITKCANTIAIIIITLLCGFTIIRDKDDLIEKIIAKLEAYRTYQFQEKIYLHFDKPYYTPGEDIWFKTYLIDGHDHRPESLSTIAHVELISPIGKILASKNIRIENGGGAGDFQLADSLKPGRYLIRAYTNFMRNFDHNYFFQKKIDLLGGNPSEIDRKSHTNDPSTHKVVKISESKVHIQFFPEGGDLVNGVMSMVGFKAMDENGKGIDVQGSIVDDKEQTVSFFQSTKFGIGAFNLSPQKGNRYYAKLSNPSIDLKFAIPKALDRGYVMHTDNSKKEHVSINIKTNIPKGLRNASLIGQMRGIPVVTVPNLPEKEEINLRVPKSGLQDGILQLTLFDENGEPHCERLVFIENAKNAVKVELSSNHELYDTRETSDIHIVLKDPEGNPVEGNLSMAITDSELIYQVNEEQEDIKSYFLLSSDLKGEIENPGYYFNEKNEYRKIALDYLLMTQGWRRFTWKSILSDSIAKLEYLYEKGFNFSGQLTRLDNEKKPVEGFVSIMVHDGTFNFNKIDTDETGRFLFMGHDIIDSTQVVIQGGIEKERRKKKEAERTKIDKFVKIRLDEFHQPPVNTVLLSQLRYFNHFPRIYQEYLNEQARIRALNATYTADDDVIVLEEVEIKGAKDRRNDPFYNPGQLYSNPNRRVVIDSLGFTRSSILETLRGRVPELNIRTVGFDYQVSVKGAISYLDGTAEPLFLVDGAPVNITTFNSINPNNVFYVDVLRGPRAAIYGSRGTGGVIALYTKSGANIETNESRKGIINFTHPGYYKAREFYSPDYTEDKPEHERPDFRTTLYWNPSIKIDSTGNTTVSFFTADSRSTFKIILEGITESGIPVRAQKFIKVGHRP
ncbi:TonB-dependent receptor plug domain-containing protein [Fulvivirgaceae bacterium BMA10]|uniref:TonB-dependent receptor plug domain-containing protein n=1 Tax=Splendidivirga corallicola TaxID=3051826 RepID=A0ABT8KMB8_9BACT|nr:TonB-dependent receptor plug domain-containing protein [Fulvivirgaceae bacterium BMA10]